MLAGRVLHSEVLDGEIRLEAELPESLARKMVQYSSPAQDPEHRTQPAKT